MTTTIDDDVMDRNGEGKTDTKAVPKHKKPSMWKVVVVNDEYTPMDFVVMILMKYFKKSIDEATQIMMEVHTKGRGIAGVYTHEIAETKALTVSNVANKNGFALLLQIEPVDD